MPKLTYVLKGIKSLQSRTSHSKPRTRLPITPKILQELRVSLLESTFDNVMLWAASLLCFYGFLRSGEVSIPSASVFDPSAHLCLNDISVNNALQPTIVRVHLKTSKTDPFRLGVDVHIGHTSNALCPVAALLSYLSARGSKPGLLFHFHNGSPLTKSKFTSQFRKALTSRGIDSSLYAGHSFRIGAATTASLNGVEHSLIQTLGHWKSSADSAYLTYIRIPPQKPCRRVSAYLFLAATCK